MVILFEVQIKLLLGQSTINKDVFRNVFLEASESLQNGVRRQAQFQVKL